MLGSKNSSQVLSPVTMSFSGHLSQSTLLQNNWMANPGGMLLLFRKKMITQM
jgi:hypothetical protein